MSTKYRQEHTTMQQLAMSVLEQSDKLEDYDPDLQMAIRKVLIQYWQKLFLPAFKDFSDAYSLMLEAVQHIQEQFKPGRYSSEIYKYLVMVLVKLMRPQQLD